MATSKKPSRRAAQRLAKEILDQQTTVPTLPEELESMLTGYRVLSVNDTDWGVARPVLLEVMRRCHIRGAASFRKHLGVVAQYLVYRVQEGLSIGIETAFSAAHIDHYYLHGLATASDRTRNDYRSRLLKVAEHVAVGVDAPVKAPSLGHRSVRSGYTVLEEAQIRRVAMRQRSDLRRRQMCAIVGLTIGAGLQPSDLRPLTIDHIVDHGVGGIQVNIPGESPPHDMGASRLRGDRSCRHRRSPSRSTRDR